LPINCSSTNKRTEEVNLHLRKNNANETSYSYATWFTYANVPELSTNFN